MKKNKLTLLLFILFAFKVEAQIQTDIYTVQQDITLIGKKVAVMGIVTAATGIFHPGITYIEDEKGGPWSGIVLWDNTTKFYASEGDQLRVIGVVTEFYGRTQINIEQYYINPQAKPLPPVVLVKTGDIATGSSTAESYEAVLVKVDSVSVTDDNLGYGEWLVDDGSGACRIDDDADFLSYQVPTVGTQLTSIAGVLNFSNNNFKLEPRYRSDIIDTDTSSGINTYTIPQIQQDITLIGQDVIVTGIVTAATGIFHSEKTFIEDSHGGPLSGILLWDSTAAFQANEGDDVRITGTVYEDNGFTEIIVDKYEILSTGNPLPPIELVNTGDIATNASKAESFEGVLVRVTDVYVANNILGNGEWEVNDVSDGSIGMNNHCLIGNDADSLSFNIPPIGTHLSSITGILNYNNNNFKLEPRYRSDIIESAISPIGDTLTIIQRPLINIPAVIQSDDTLEIICELSQNPSSWNASLIHKNREIMLITLGQEFNSEKQLWTLKAILPETNFYELYDLKLDISGEDVDFEKNAVKIIPNFEGDFYFIHVTDTHLPSHLFCRDDNYDKDTSEMKDFREVIKDINLINPAFVLHTGDLVNEGELESFLNHRYYTKAKDILSELEVPVYLVSGNHDVGGWFATPMPDGTARRDWWRIFGWKYLNDPPSSNPQYTQDYTFNYGNCHFIGMEAYLNYDWWRSEIYGGESFTNQQLDWLQQNVNNQDNSLLKILFYHYDFNNSLDLDGLGIDLALYGHSHSNIGSIYNSPFELCTAACCDGRRAYRLIRVQGNTIKPSSTIYAGSNGGNLRIEYVNSNSDSLTTTAIVTNQTDEKFENALVKFSISPGVISKIENGSLVQIDSLISPWTAYVSVSLSPQSTTRVKLHYLVSDINDFENINNSYSLAQNYPNPFNNSTRIDLSISKSGAVSIEIIDIKGKLIYLKNMGHLESGDYSFNWNAKDNNGEKVPSGLYFYTIRSFNYYETKKMILLQ